MAEKKKKEPVVVDIKRARCFSGNVVNELARCVTPKCDFKTDCMWRKRRGELSPQLGSMPENRKTILSR